MARGTIATGIKYRTTIPESMLIDGSNSANWSETTGTGITKTTDSSVTYNGAATTKVVIPGATTGNIQLGTIGATVPVPLWDGDIQHQRLVAMFKCSDVSRISSMSFLIGDATFAVTLAQGSTFPYGWKNDTWIAAAKGTPTWTKTGAPFPMAGAQRLRLRWVVTAGADMTLWCAKAVMAPLGRPCIVLSIDDGYAENYTFLRPECISRNLPCSFSIDPAFINASGYMTEAQLVALANDASGLFDISNHGLRNEQYRADVTPEQYIKNVIYTRQWLAARGLTKGLNNHVWVGGQFDAAGVLMLSDAGFVAARNTNQPRYQHPYVDSNWPGSLLNIQLLCGLDNTTTLSQAKGFIDQTMQAGQVGFINGHKFAGAPGVAQWAQTDMQALLDYIALRRNRGECDVLSFSQYVDQTIYGLRGW